MMNGSTLPVALEGCVHFESVRFLVTRQLRQSLRLARTLLDFPVVPVDPMVATGNPVSQQRDPAHED
jgi:hypothetical protein